MRLPASCICIRNYWGRELEKYHHKPSKDYIDWLKECTLHSAKSDTDKPSEENEKKYKEELRKATTPDLCKIDAEQKIKYHELAKTLHSNASYKGKVLTSLPEFAAIRGSADPV